MNRMKAESRHRRSAVVLITIALGILAGWLLCGSPILADSPKVQWLKTGKLTDRASYLVYLPDDLEAEKKYPLVFALSPGGDALSMISTWAAVAGKHHWIIAASKKFRNGQEFGPSLKEIEAELNDVEGAYAIDTTRVIFTGISGGGMGAHAVARYYPSRVRAIAVNTGMMHASFMTGVFPEGKTVVFLASPTDFRYGEMKRDRSFLEQHHWKIRWIEFAGGHTLAPAAVYEEAAGWLDLNMR